jgi:predicted MFS family arabinose efflux permease
MIVLRVFLPFALGYFLSYLLRVVNAVIAPDLVRDIGLDASDLGLMTSVAFLLFGAFQLPLGILLDRFGPRRTEAALLVVAAGGAFLFASAQGLAGLVAGRALIGLGTSACLMAAFKAYVQWFPRERLPLVNGFQMAAGGLGALAGTAPIELALGLTDWRGLFGVFGVLALAIAGGLFLAVPEKAEQAAGSGLREQLRGVRQIFTSRAFWDVAPATLTSQGSFLAIQSLWIGPWLADVAGLGREVLATHLLGVAAAMVAGYILLGSAAARLGRLGITPPTLAGSGMTLFALTQLALLLSAPHVALWLWPLFGFFGTAGIVTYAALSQSFPPALAGRVVTGLNVLTFSTAFAAQWGIGAVINLWPAAPGGGYAPDGYRPAFAIMLGLQAAALAWFWIRKRRGDRDSRRH